MKKIALITGASSGMGRETALKLKQNGYIVYGAARRVERMQELESDGINILPLDLTRDESIVACVNSIVEKEGRVDVLINNAGYGSYGAVEDVSIEEAKRQFEVNIFGLARLTQLVLPHMREHKFGKIVNISSMGGKIYTLFGTWYHATKHALEGFSDCLRIETKDMGIDVIIIQPGGIKTPWGQIAADNLIKTSGNGPYAEKAKAAAKTTQEMYNGNKVSDPSVISNLIFKAISARKPKTRYAAGYMAKPAMFMRKWFGDAFFDRMITRA